MGVKKYITHLFPSDFFVTPVYFRAIALALLYLGILLSELFTFEKYSGILSEFGLPGGHVTVVVFTWLMPLVLAGALPFLISMRLSTWLYKISRGLAIAAPVLWLVLGVWMNISNSDGHNTGLFGATLTTPVGWWIVGFALLWLGVAILCVRELPRRKE